MPEPRKCWWTDDGDPQCPYVDTVTWRCKLSGHGAGTKKECDCDSKRRAALLKELGAPHVYGDRVWVWWPGWYGPPGRGTVAKVVLAEELRAQLWEIVVDLDAGKTWRLMPSRVFLTREAAEAARERGEQDAGND